MGPDSGKSEGPDMNVGAPQEVARSIWAVVSCLYLDFFLIFAFLL